MQTSTDLDLGILNDLEFQVPCESEITGHTCTGKVKWVCTYTNGHPPKLVCDDAYHRALIVMADGYTHCHWCMKFRGAKILTRDCWHYSPIEN